MMRNVIVTGGSRGIGLEISRALADSGFNVIAIARSRGDALSQAIDHYAVNSPGRLHHVEQDLADTAAIKTMVKSVRAKFGEIYGLVNNAGIGTGGLLANMSEPDIEQLVTLNLVAPVVLTKYVIRSMMAARAGRVVNISSIVAMTGYQGLSVYSATKASLVGFTRSLAREVGPLGITVNAVAPGFVDTAMTDGLDEAGRQAVIRRSALRRLPDSEDIGHAVTFLMSEKAKNITGTVMTVDAGSTA